MLLNIHVVQKHWRHFDIRVLNIFLSMVLDKKIVIGFLLLKVLAQAHIVPGDEHVEEVEKTTCDQRRQSLCSKLKKIQYELLSATKH